MHKNSQHFIRHASTPARPPRRVSVPAAALVVAVCVGSAFVGKPAVAAPSVTNQALPSLADTPGSTSSLPEMDRALHGGTLKLVNGRVLLDSDVMLKVYISAWSKKPLDPSRILTENTENIPPPRPVVPTPEQKAAIDRLVAAARAHPDVLIQVGDVAFEPYDRATRTYSMDNRLFLDGAHYYFDNSPYHFDYVLEPARSLQKIRCDDAKVRGTIDAAIANYEHFGMNIEGRVTASTGDTLWIAPQRITLEDAVGGPLLSQEAAH